jgi:hypothetical protein
MRFLAVFTIVVVQLASLGRVTADPVTGQEKALVIEFAAPLSEARLREFWEVEFLLSTPGGGPVEGAGFLVSGGMPAHGHGLPTTPKVTEIGQGRYVLKGLKFTMPGEWVVVLDVTAQGLSDKIIFPFNL